MASCQIELNTTAKLEDTFVGVSSLVEHGRDFAFRKNNGEIANHVREEFLDGGGFAGLATLQDIFIDEEEDIGVRTDRGTWYLSPTSVSIVGWPIKMGELAKQGCLDELSKLTQLLFERRKALGAEMFSIRLFFLPGPVPDSYVAGLADLALRPLRTVLGPRTAQGAKASQFLTTFTTGAFKSTLELDLQPREVELRYTREARAKSFESYTRFLEQAQLGEMAEDLRTLLASILALPAIS